MRVKVDVVARFTHIWKTGVVVTALLATVVACGSSDSSRERNVALVAGTTCAKPGQVSKISKVSVVCAKTITGNIWYPTMKSQGRAVSCAKSGAVRKKKAVVWVCGVTKGKKLWNATSPLPAAVLLAAAVVEPGVSQPVIILESTNVATPSQPVVADNNVLANPAIPDEPSVTTPSTVPDATTTTSTTIAKTTTTSTTIAKTTTTSTTIPKTTTTVAQTTTTTTTIPKTTTTTVPNSYKVGDKGPSGGIIIYVDLARPVGSRFFEAACAGWSDGTCGGSDLIDPKATWGCPASMLAGADGQGIGAGKQNTIGIVAGCADPGIAARLADVLVLGGQSDWFLPSREELNEVYKLNASIGGFSSDFYWSSFQYRPDVGFAWGRFFSAAPRLSDWKKNLNYVRPVRSF